MVVWKKNHKPLWIMVILLQNYWSTENNSRPGENPAAEAGHQLKHKLLYSV